MIDLSKIYKYRLLSPMAERGEQYRKIIRELRATTREYWAKK
jgi:hypothetical protein